jgi:hypothetical protein
MNAKARMLLSFTILVLVFCSFCLESAFAQNANSACVTARGNWLDTLNASGGTSGAITSAGILNGTTVTVYNPAFVLTPNPTVVAYIAETTITTVQGQLKTSNVYLYDFVTGVGTVMGRINSKTSTGRFAGATGVLYFNTTKTIGVPPNQSFVSEIAGQICFAN